MTSVAVITEAVLSCALRHPPAMCVLAPNDPLQVGGLERGSLARQRWSDHRPPATHAVFVAPPLPSVNRHAAASRDSSVRGRLGVHDQTQGAIRHTPVVHPQPPVSHSSNGAHSSCARGRLRMHDLPSFGAIRGHVVRPQPLATKHVVTTVPAVSSAAADARQRGAA